jgi:hypothetical protein
MNMTRVGIYLAIFFVIAVVAFNNCAGKFEAVSALNSFSNASAQCRQKIAAAAKIADIADATVCEHSGNYQCDWRRFRPDVNPGKSQETRCVNIAGLGDTCVPVVIYNYNTRAQQQSAVADEMVEGGAYNRDEASCINTQIVSQRVALIQAEGSSLEQALENTVEQCRRRSHL